MRKKRKPHAERTPEDYWEAADNSLELAKVLAWQGGISNQDFLERMARSDELAEHDGETCGQCHNMIVGAEDAREMIEAGEYEDVVSKWAAETQSRWENSKFFKLWQKEKEVGRDPHQAFEEHGWGKGLPSHQPRRRNLWRLPVAITPRPPLRVSDADWLARLVLRSGRPQRSPARRIPGRRWRYFSCPASHRYDYASETIL
jgi:hypothetical protein